jgi:hypothetical protein
MIFIPCKDGICHNEIEDAKPAHIDAGCNVLLHAMLERAIFPLVSNLLTVREVRQSP